MTRDEQIKQWIDSGISRDKAEQVVTILREAAKGATCNEEQADKMHRDALRVSAADREAAPVVAVDEAVRVGQTWRNNTYGVDCEVMKFEDGIVSLVDFTGGRRSYRCYDEADLRSDFTLITDVPDGEVPVTMVQLLELLDDMPDSHDTEYGASCEPGCALCRWQVQLHEMERRLMDGYRIVKDTP